MEARRLGQLGRVGRQVGGCGSTHPAHLVPEDVPDLGPIAMDRRDQDVRREIVAELDDHLGEIGLPDGDPLLAEGFVELDLLGRHRLDLDDLRRTMSPRDGRDDRVRFGGVTGPVDRAAGRRHVGLELFEQRGQVAQDLVLDRLAGQAERLPVGAFGDDRGPFRPDRGGRTTEVRSELFVRQGRPRGLRKRRGPGEAGLGT